MIANYPAWREYVIEMVEEGVFDKMTLLHAALQYMSNDDVKDMLAINELLPEDDDFDDYNYVGSPMHY